jgi:hypothetical protein
MGYNLDNILCQYQQKSRPILVKIIANGNADASKITGAYIIIAQSFSFLGGSATLRQHRKVASLYIYIRMEEYRKSLVTRQLLLLFYDNMIKILMSVYLYIDLF